MMQKTALRRRRRSKGTIVAYGQNNNANNNNKNDERKGTINAEQTDNDMAAATNTPEKQQQQKLKQQSPNNNNNTTLSNSIKAAAITNNIKPCHAARLTLLCAQNAVRLGARTQLFLCPPGRNRRHLQAALRQRPRQSLGTSANKRLSSNNNAAAVITSAGSDEYYYGVDKLVGAAAYADYAAQEEGFLLSANTATDEESDEEASSGDDDELEDIDELFSEQPSSSADLQEKYKSIREPLYVSAANDNAYANGTPMLSSMGPGAPGKLPFNRRKIRYFDSVTATDRAIARAYLTKEMKRSKQRAAHMLTRHLRKVQAEARRKKQIERGETPDPINVEDAADDKDLFGVQPFPAPMTPAASAALLLESLALNQLESVEGMSKCYDGIVAAGLALLDSQIARSDIIAALAPLLITALEQPSGESILQLAKLRRLCGTPRYQRRFVQRIAPCLIRPPRGAMWCLWHQNDMEAILAATELLLDCAFDIFKKGWYERGRLLLADTKRAETLHSAARQLRNLSSAADGLALTLPGHNGSVNRRRMIASANRTKKGALSTDDSLADWEVIAVDRQIRVSISDAMSMDWSRIATSILDIPRPHYRRATKSTLKRIATVPPTTSSEIGSNPRSPARPVLHNNSPSLFFAGTEHADSWNASQEQSLSPPPSSAPTSPPVLHRSKSSESFKTPMNPPRSPKSPIKTPTLDQMPFGATQIDANRGKFTLLPLKDTVGNTTPTGLASGMMPLSPSASSVGTSGSGDMIQFKPLSHSAPLSSNSAQYRNLTSTAAVRKGTVAACRALRAQIQLFEDGFIRLHGRPPKGGAERAPLATTYTQYRDWKRAIRADAACRIQALVRGAKTRGSLLRINNPTLSRVVLTRAGRPRSAETIMNQLSIPAEIGHPDLEHEPSRGYTASSNAEQFPASQRLAPQWASKVVRRRNSGDQGETLPTVASKPYYSPPDMHLNSSTSGMNHIPLSDLQAQKRDLKQKLKQYDIEFARKTGRMPVKAEKEPIRHLYESYNSLKTQISLMEQGGRHLPPSVHAPIIPNNIAPLPQRAVSPTSGSESGHSGSEDSPARTSSISASRVNRKLPKGASPPLSGGHASSSSQDLAGLKAEKSQLHQMLRSYEKDFFKQHKRQVSSFADIKAVASQYKRYKEIKKAIASFQGDTG
jgi:hypothetical protein